MWHRAGVQAVHLLLFFFQFRHFVFVLFSRSYILKDLGRRVDRMRKIIKKGQNLLE